MKIKFYRKLISILSVITLLLCMMSAAVFDSSWVASLIFATVAAVPGFGSYVLNRLVDDERQY